MDDLCLKFNQKYLVETRNNNYYIGEYKEFTVDSHGYVMYYILDNVTNYHTNKSFWQRKPKPEKLKYDVFFSPTDKFYELEEIRKNGKRARQAMEQRALDMILKRLVNEHFEWS
jgi:hypothetical protein|uniref:Uncharacterized protein n=1 Tax=viral metagenome TaxID=1070528 RepID=A0A6C0D2M4_9ZZZZ